MTPGRLLGRRDGKDQYNERWAWRVESWPVGHPVELEARLVHLCSIRRDVS